VLKFKGHYQVALSALEHLNNVLSVVRVSSRLVPHQFPVKPLTLRTFLGGGDSPMSWSILVWKALGVAVVRTWRVALSEQAQRVVVRGKVIGLTDWPCREFSTSRLVMSDEPSVVVPVLVALINMLEIECWCVAGSTP